MVEAIQKTDNQNEENGSNAIFRTYDRLKELRQQLYHFTRNYYLLALLTGHLLLDFSSPNYWRGVISVAQLPKI